MPQLPKRTAKMWGNGYRQPTQKVYDIDEVFDAVQTARNNGSISEDRYNDIIVAMQYALSDYSQGNISEVQYQETLNTFMGQIARHGRSNGKSATAVSATDPLVNVDRDTWQQAQRLAQALGRNIVFYNGAQGENGYYLNGTIYVNILAPDPFAQVFSHELTHSLEGTKHYEDLKRFVFSRIARSNIDIAQARKAKADQYQRHGKVLKGKTEIDAEIVAEYVQTHLLTDEQSIMELVTAEPNVAKRIWKWATNLLRRMVGSQTSRDRAELEHMERIYAKALRESRGDDAGSGTVSVRSQSPSGDQTQVDDLVLARERTERDYREGRISDEEYDAAMDEYDRAQEERLGSSVEKYSFENSNSKVPQKWLRQAYVRKPISLSKKDWSKVNDARAEKYRGLEENQIPEVDFFPLAEYNELNIGHMYVIRNYGIDTFAVISKKRLTGRYDGYLMEAANDGRTVQKVDEGAHREGAEQRGQHLGNQMPRNEGALSGDAEGSGEYGNAEQGNSSADGGLDSGSGIKTGSGAKYSFAYGDKAETVAESYDGVSLTDDAHSYTYDFLVAQPDMITVNLPSVDNLRDGNGRIDTAKVISDGMNNALSVGTKRADKVFVKNRYTGRELRIDVSSIRHGLNGSMNRLITNARLGSVIGEVVQNAIPINALNNTADVAVGTYAMAGYATDKKGREIVAIITVEQRNDSVSSIDTYDVTHAVSGRQKRSNRLDTKSQGVYPTAAASTISIEDFLAVVKDTFQSILSDDVLTHFGESKSVEGHYYGRAKYSFSDTQTDHEQRSRNGWHTTDEAEMQAHKKGYPKHWDSYLSKEQQEYFKDSKVRDEQGRLMVMYHGTSNGGFTVFDAYGSNFGLFGQGLYFTDNPEVAESYTHKGKATRSRSTRRI